ncbi:hypothetical protein EHQ52_03955 [Leptospira koniambonensis]|uniref:YopA central domain-containing protein n=1 Tax=Leptospira koniambonensis TaxID=2484950 RepID=A0A4V3JNP9_9LEPT|nr:hypothetical protein [Leptospira koniambonensis]TGL35929.1 hypothetical protein EHQ52_03955 [Leptospira koniambonensis]
MFKIVPKTLRSRFLSKRSNECFIIGKFSYKLIQNNQDIALEGVLKYYLSPFPYAELNTQLSYHLTISFGSCEIAIEERKYRASIYHISHVEGKTSFKIRIVESVLIGTNANADFILCHIPNFIDNEGFATRTGRGIIHGRLVLEDEEYKVILDKLFDFDRIIKNLSYFPGTSITHKAIICKKNEQKITFDEFEKKLKDLDLFLSFLKGSRIKSILHLGYKINYFGRLKILKRPFFIFRKLFQKGIFRKKLSLSLKYFFAKEEKIWEYLRYEQKFEYYKIDRSFFRFDISEDIMKLYPKFISKVGDANWGKGLKLVLDIYFQTNKKDADYITLININQIVFEAISWLKFVEIDCRYTASDYKKSNLYPAHKKLKELLNWLNISDVIPVELKELQQFGSSINKNSASEVITFIRNRYVHPSQIFVLNSFSEKMMEEAWTLGCHYIDLILLRIIEHDTNYYNRIKNKIEQVPW